MLNLKGRDDAFSTLLAVFHFLTSFILSRFLSQMRMDKNERCDKYSLDQRFSRFVAQKSTPDVQHPMLNIDNSMLIQRQWLEYFLLGFLWIFIVDFGTLGGFRFAYWQVPLTGHLLRVIVFSLAMFVAGYFIFKRNWSGGKLFFLTLIIAFVVEIPISKNALLYTFPQILWGIPMAIIGYSAIIYLPLWLVKGQIKENKKKAFLLSLFIVLIFVLSFFTQK